MKSLLIALFFFLAAIVLNAQSPAGANQEIQFNNNGSFGATSNLRWYGTNLFFGDLGTRSAGLHFSSESGDASYIFSENWGSNQNRLVFLTTDDGNHDYFLFRNKHWSHGDLDVFEIHRSYTRANGNFQVIDGNVGIGTTSPSDNLHLRGDNATIRLSSDTYYGGSGGALGSILSTIKFSNRDDNHNYRAEIRGLLTGSWAQHVGLAFTTHSSGQQVERMRIGHDGNVGIGTTSPEDRLQVVSNDYNNIFSIKRDNTSNGNTFDFAITSHPRGVAALNSRSLTIQSMEHAADIAILTDPSISQPQFVVKKTGNVGVGTTDPFFNLHVAGSFGTSGYRFTVANGIINQNSTIENWGSASDWGGLAFNYDGRSTPDGVSQTYFRDMSIYNGKGEIVGFFDGSNKSLGINTTSTGSHKLAVEGSIGAREIKVEASGSGWSDFVFDDDYDLRPLEEVEQYIAENHHLPEIPSEAEVTENGINLGEMNAKLLQKIEELTLYLIEEHKSNVELRKEVEELKKQVSEK